MLVVTVEQVVVMVGQVVVMDGQIVVEVVRPLRCAQQVLVRDFVLDDMARQLFQPVHEA
jgi:hypothetical protein